jgi:hypothetical protein
MQSVRICISTPLEAPADLVWEILHKTRSLRYVAKPLLCFRGNLPERWPGPGGVVRVERMMFFCVIPAWSHELRMVRFDEDEREILSNERGGPVKVWNHRIKVEPLSDRHCLYTDELEVHAGVLTLLIWLFAHLFYRYRQMRWRNLAQVLG